MEEATESKRDRVRRLLIDPLKTDGFRFAKGVTSDDAKTRLDRLAETRDELAFFAHLIRRFVDQNAPLPGNTHDAPGTARQKLTGPAS